MHPIDRVNPRPRQVRLGTGCVDLEGCQITFEVDSSAGLPAEGYRLSVEGDGPDGSEGAVRGVGADERGRFYAEQTFDALAGAACTRHRRCVPAADVVDWPALPLRSSIEGFYGRPWSHSARLEHLRFSGRNKLNTYVYAPKDDTYHRERWRDLYPGAELARLRELVSKAAGQHLDFVYALSPGLSMVYSDPAESEALHAKCAQLWEAGVRRFALLFDDIPPELVHEPDRAAFGDAPSATAVAHAQVCRRFAAEFLAPRGAAPTANAPLLMVPTDYAGISPSPYRDRLRDGLPDHTVVWWTGTDIVVGEVGARDADAARETFGRPLALWDNFPVNDFDAARVFLGPLTGRDGAIGPQTLHGITANLMTEAAASQLALATVADYAWDPAGYDPGESHARALGGVLGDDPGLRPLVEACASWPPSADPWPRLSRHLERVLAGSASDVDALVDLLQPLAQMPDDGDSALARELRPWVLAGQAMARAGLEAAALARGNLDTGGALPAARTRALAALDEAEQHEADVLRGVIPPFVRKVLDVPHRALDPKV